MTEAFASGWENPDHHPPLTERPRPMFDASGRPVTEAPPPDPAPELDNFLRPGDIQPAAVPGQPTPQSTGMPRLLEIHAIAQRAVDSDSRVYWLAALSEILELSR